MGVGRHTPSLTPNNNQRKKNGRLDNRSSGNSRLFDNVSLMKSWYSITLSLLLLLLSQLTQAAAPDITPEQLDDICISRSSTPLIAGPGYNGYYFGQSGQSCATPPGDNFAGGQGITFCLFALSQPLAGENGFNTTQDGLVCRASVLDPTMCETQPDGSINCDPPVQCVSGVTQTIFRNLSSTSTEVPPASQVQLDDGCDYDVVLESCNIFSSGPGTPIGDIANNGDGTSTLCSYTATSTGTSGDSATDLTFDGDLPPDIQPLESTDTRESTESTETDPPTTETNTDGSTSTTTSSTTTETTSSGTDLTQNGDQFTSTSHNEMITTTTTTTTTTTFTNGDVTSSRDVTETNTGGGTTTRRLNPDGSIQISGTEDQDNTTTTNTISNIAADGSGDSNTTGGQCVGVGCDDTDSGGVCELAPVLCDAAEFILEVVTLPDHPDLPIADQSSGDSLDTTGFQAPIGTCLANPTISVFGNNIELPFDQTVCAFCDLMRPIMIVIASFVAIGVLLGGRSD